MLNTFFFFFALMETRKNAVHLGEKNEQTKRAHVNHHFNSYGMVGDGLKMPRLEIGK